MHTSLRHLGRLGLLAVALGATPLIASCDSATKLSEMVKSVGLDPTQLAGKLGSYTDSLNGISGSVNNLMANAMTDPKGAVDKFTAAAKSFSGENGKINGVLNKLTGNNDLLRAWLDGAGANPSPDQLRTLTDTMKQFGAESGKFQGMLNDLTGTLANNPSSTTIAGAKDALNALGPAKGQLTKATEGLMGQLKSLMP